MHFEQDERLARRAQLIIAKGIMEVLPNRPFYTLIVISTNVEIDKPKHMVIGQTNNTLSTIFVLEVACQQTLVDYLPKLSIVITIASN